MADTRTTDDALTSPWDLGPAPTPLPPSPVDDDPYDALEPVPAPPASITAPASPPPATAPDPQHNPADVPAAVQPTAVPPSARRVFDDLLAIGMTRPVAGAGTVTRVRAAFDDAVTHVSSVWPETTMRVSKSALAAVTKCEGNAVATRTSSTGAFVLPLPMAVGQVTHKAVQMSWTHPGRDVGVYVREAITGAMQDSDDFAGLWANAPMATQSDIIAAATVRTTAFVDSFPPLLDQWAPRFEEPIVARVGPIVLTGRPDLIVGRPRDGARRTMLLCDFKSSDLNPSHEQEALFYAVVATLRYDVMPWRSTVLSLASGLWTPPDFTDEELVAGAVDIAERINALCDVWTQQRAPLLTGGVWCRWCPAKATCPGVPTE